MLFKFMLVCLFCCTGNFANSHVINWQQTKNWKLYNYSQFAALSLSLDSIKHFQSVVLNDDHIRSMLQNADTMKGPTKTILWMGLFTVTYEYQNKERKMEAGYYGGFFYDDTSKTYYELDEDTRDEWQNYFVNLDSSSFNILPSKEIR